MPTIILSTAVTASPERCFDLSIDVDVHIASGKGERVVRGVRSGMMRLGDEVTWQARHFGILWRMTSVITSFDRPSYFVDEMKSGPFARWRHEHLFSVEGVGTMMLDKVEYALPLGWLGRLADRLLLARYLEQLLLTRNKHITTVAEEEARRGRP
ncbi:MAG: SRPBCC family protein [Actinobacteria bacterium]|nr:SRPBCC family protein [Actinomycetota bacterium]